MFINKMWLTIYGLNAFQKYFFLYTKEHSSKYTTMMRIPLQNELLLNWRGIVQYVFDSDFIFPTLSTS